MTTDDATPDDENPLSDGERSRQAPRRIQAVAQSKLPEWAPDALVRRYAAALQSVELAREAVQRARLNPPPPLHTDVFGDPDKNLRRADDHATLLYRLAQYQHADMHAAWRPVTTRKRVGLARLPSLAADADLIAGRLIETIKAALTDFDGLSKRTAAQRKRGAGKVAKLAVELAQAIKDDPDARALARDYPARQVIIQHLLDHGEAGDVPSLPLEHYPIQLELLELYPPQDRLNRLSDSTVDETGDDVPFARWNDHDRLAYRLAWLLRVIGPMTLNDLLRDFATDLQRVAATKPEISRPNSGEARTRFLINRLSDFMRGYYGSPLDEAVAAFVSAALDLPAPLDRDDVRDATAR